MNISLVPVTRDRYDDYIRINVEVFGHFHGFSEPCEKSREILHWKAAERANTPIMMWIGALDGEPAGFLSAATMDLCDDGRMTRAFETFEGGVLPTFRRRGVMPAIVDEVHRRLETEYPLALGFPNEPLARVYLRVGYKQVGVYTYWYQNLDYRPLVHQRIPVRPVSSLIGSAASAVRARRRTVPRGYDLKPIEQPTEGHAKRWVTHVGTRPFACARTVPEWKWRLSSHGLLEGWWYDVVRDGQWQGTFALARSRQPRDDPVVVRVAELFARTEETQDATLRLALAEATRRKFRSVTTGCLDGHPVEELLEATGFRRGHRLAFTIRPGPDTEVNERWFNSSNWELFGSDRLL